MRERIEPILTTVLIFAFLYSMVSPDFDTKLYIFLAIVITELGMGIKGEPENTHEQ